MKKLLTTILLLSSVSLACPSVKGYMAGGLFKQTSSLKPLCGAEYTVYKRSFLSNPDLEFVELYEFNLKNDARQFAKNTLSNLSKKGYFVLKSTNTDESTQIGMTNGERVLVFHAFPAGNKLYVGFIGSRP